MKLSIASLFALLFAASLLAQQPDLTDALESHGRSTSRSFEDTQRYVDDVLWYFKLARESRREMWEFLAKHLK